MAKKKIYGSLRKKREPIPGFYNQETELKIINHGNEIAWGRHTDDGFVLKIDSIILDRDNSDNKSLENIKTKLLDDKLLGEHCEGGSYTLKEDIYLHYPSTAGKLVLGQNSNGFKDWKDENGKTLDELLGRTIEK